ncbi:Sieve element occlusion, N-terminal [Dillenia turbinata]|uniref:Sieve element occlusion, N-terminal n=1 Tax=Dillenia turbinata TaxID=194707 RepID=A0AAN8VBD9_9MAGN
MSSSKPNPVSSLQQLIKGDRSMFMASDDKSMLNQILTTHSPDEREVDVKPLLHLLEDILQHSHPATTDTITLGNQKHAENLDEKTHEAGFAVVLEALSCIIDRISCEIQCKCMSGSDVHQTTISLFEQLSDFTWDAKLVLILAAFALNYGEFWLLAQIYTTNQLAKSMAVLKQLPVILEHSGPLRPRFEAINNLINAILDVTKCIVEFKDLRSLYITQDQMAFSAAMAHVPTAVYWSVRGVVACAAEITSLTSMGHEYVALNTETWELLSLAHKINSRFEHLKKQLALCYQYIDERRNLKYYDVLKNIFDTIHVDNMKVLRALIYQNDDLQPLLDGSTKKRVNIDTLRRKNVLLLISGLDITHEELSILKLIHNESRVETRLERRYEVVWVPIVDHNISWSDSMQQGFESLQSTMPWYSVHHPSLIDKEVIKFVKDVWNFRNKPILVVIDPQGRVVNPNAIHLMWIWGNNAFPFTSMREQALWREEVWRLELLVNGVDPVIFEWIREDKYIFLYGGDDMDWIRKFTTEARTVTRAAQIPLEMVYVGKSNKREQVRQSKANITAEKLSSTWLDLTKIWWFWTRLESMLCSKIQHGRVDDQDPVTREIKKILSYDRSSNGWAVLTKGSTVVLNGHGSTVLHCLGQYDLWKEQVPVKGFDGAFKDHHGMIHGASPPCCRLEFATDMGLIPESLKCPECLRLMEKSVTFFCCHDEGALTPSTRY